MNIFPMGEFPLRRMRRLRQSVAMRELVREMRLSPGQFRRCRQGSLAGKVIVI